MGPFQKQHACMHFMEMAKNIAQTIDRLYTVYCTLHWSTILLLVHTRYIWQL